MNLYIFSYNNYYNRIVKREESLEGYGEYIHLIPNCRDFTPGDHIDTTHVFGNSATNYNGTGDYCVVTDGNEIVSRWFIIETKFLRSGQWQLNLRRDLLVDFYEDVINAPCFIERASLSLNDPLILAKENNTFNQIKKEETLLKDQSDCPWAIIYYSLNPEHTINGTIENNKLRSLPHIEIDETRIEDWKFWQYSNLNGYSEKFYGAPSEGYYKINARKGSNNGTEYRFSSSMVSGETDYVEYSVKTYKSQGVYFPNDVTAKEQSEEIKRQIQPKLTRLNSMAKNIVNFSSEEELNELLSYNGKLIQVGSVGLKYYSVEVQEAIADEERTVELPDGSNLQLELQQIATDSGMTITSQASEANFELEVIATSYYVILREEKDEILTYNVTADVTRIIPSDVPYGILAIPLGDIKVKLPGTANDDFYTNKEYALTVASRMWTQQAKKIYDVQILPYCPCQELISDKREITVTNSNQYSLIKAQETLGSTTQTLCGIILNVPKARFTFDIPVSIKKGQTAIQRKINNECDKWRLASPNYSNYFDFSVEENNGVQYFNVDCEYKPYTPYIHLNPNFGNLYGKDFNDPRGLILGGDFSITNVEDTWEQYELQNKNYQNIFNRQIQSMELEKGWGLATDITGATTGAISGAVTGAMVGSVIPVVGTAAGAIIGGVTSAVGGTMDVIMNSILREDKIDLAKDTFNYQNANIKAMPYTIGKLSAFNNNNKLFPVLEYYTCTDREKIMFANSLAYRGMSVNAIGTIKDYLNNNWVYQNISANQAITSKGYIKGKIIRIDTLHDDFHLINSIAEEIYRGGYF